MLRGHSNFSRLTPAQLQEDVEWRKEWAEKIGLGFKLTSLQLEVGKAGQLSRVEISARESGVVT
jgi:hypothetical protein